MKIKKNFERVMGNKGVGTGRKTDHKGISEDRWGKVRNKGNE